ncbi:Vgb family protein [Polyangium mundeleinium]|uniref:DUF5050 domain-containing protein n=1 Tax=Polyangium mundeleinium TaxID=2995306 RepID=A0ABT5EY68_9BACT|nr:DUF5050 domain-containing protein [Polyangium mundeleinium]MDC0746103.1 DUF5050 domain-containing protein [Polyangium mundeleinium]
MNKYLSSGRSSPLLGAVAALVLAECTMDVDIARSRGKPSTTIQACGGDPGGAQACNRGACAWSKRFGSKLGDSGEAIVVDRSGNLLIAGSFHGELDFGGGVTLASPTGASFLAKLDPQGNPLWSKRILGSTVMAPSLATDASRNVVLTGSVYGNVDFGGGPLPAALPGTDDMFVAKFDADGNHQWSKLVTVDKAHEYGCAIKVDDMGSIIVSGSRDYAGDSQSQSEGFLLKLDASGNQQWITKFSGSSPFGCVYHELDSAGNIFVSGGFKGLFNVEGDEGNPILTSDLASYLTTRFLAKFDSDGKHSWSKQLGRFDTHNLTVDSQGSVVVAGQFAGYVNFDGCSERGELCVVKLDATGNHVWSRQLRSIGWPSIVTAGTCGTIIGGYGIDVPEREATGNLYLDGCLLSSGSASAFLFKLDDAGQIHRAYFWDKTYNNATAAIGQDDNVFLAGTFRDTLDLGCGPMTSVGEGDIFIAKLSGTGIGGADGMGVDPTAIMKLAAGGGASSPRALALDTTSVYWTTAGSVMKVGLNGGSVTTLASDQVMPAGIAVESEKVYWGENWSTLNAVPTGGGPIVKLATDGINSAPQCVAIGGSHLYWVNSNSGDAVRRVPLAGGTAVTIVPAVDVPQCLTVDSDFVYFTSMDGDQTSTGGKIRKVPRDGGTPEVLVSGQHFPYMITADAGNLYWTDVGNDKIMKVSKSGGAPQVLATGDYPAGIAVDSNYVYWANRYAGTVMKVPVGGGPAETIAPDQNSPAAVAVDATSIYWVNEGDGTLKKTGK